MEKVLVFELTSGDVNNIVELLNRVSTTGIKEASVLLGLVEKLTKTGVEKKEESVVE